MKFSTFITTDDSMVTYGNSIPNYFEPGEHPETSAMKNFKSSFTNGVDHTLIAGLLEAVEN